MTQYKIELHRMSLWFVGCITFFFLHCSGAVQDLKAHPVILGKQNSDLIYVTMLLFKLITILFVMLSVPGDGGSQIEGKLDKNSSVHYVCSKKTDYWFSLWLNMELLVPIVIDCWVDNMKLTYDNTTRKTTNNPGVEIRIPDFGNSTSVEWIDPSKASAGNYFATIADTILKFGYERNVSLRGAPYDFRKAPSKYYSISLRCARVNCRFLHKLDELQDYFVKMKVLVEDTFTKTNQKIVLITHSMGSPMTLYFLNHQTQEWKNKYVKSWVSLAGCWGGTIKALKVYAQGVC